MWLNTVLDVNSDIGKRIAQQQSGSGCASHDERTRQNNSLKDLDQRWWITGVTANKNTPGNVEPIQVKGFPAEAEVRKNAGAIDMFLNKGKLQELKLTDLPECIVHLCEQ